MMPLQRLQRRPTNEAHEIREASYGTLSMKEQLNGRMQCVIITSLQI